MAPYLRALWSGLTEPSWAAIAIGLAIAPVVVASVVATVDEQDVRDHPEAYAIDARDDYAWATAWVLRLRDRPVERPLLLLLGGSGVREAVSSPEGLRQEILAREGPDYEVYNLGLAGAAYPEATAIVDILPAGSHGVAVIGTQPLALAVPPGAPARLARTTRFGVRLPWFDRVAAAGGADVPTRTGSYLLDNWAFVAPRLWPRLVSRVWGGTESDLHYYVDERAPSHEAEWEMFGAAIRDGWGRYSEENFEVLGELVAELRRRGFDVLLWHTPRNVAFFSDPGIRAAYEAFPARLASFAAERRVPVLDLDQEAALEAEHFYDFVHLYDRAAQQRVTAALAAGIAAGRN